MSTSGLSILIDSNVFIAAASHSNEGHAYGDEAAELLRLSAQLGYRLMISHGTRADIARAGARREARERELSKFHVLHAVPIPTDLAQQAGFPAVRSANDEADLEVLAAYHAGLGTWLVSNDGKFRKRAKRVAVDPDAVLSLAEAIDSLRRFLDTPSQMPAATTVPAYTLNLDAAIFDSLKAGYPPSAEDLGFAEWWRTKVVADQRSAIILGEATDPEGVAILKDETHNDHRLTGRVTKICTLKVADDFTGTKRGEALLKAVLDHARLNNRDTLFVEVLPTIETLPGWLESFGFELVGGATTKRGEMVYAKQLKPPPGAAPLPALDHAIKYGPGSALISRVYLVPIQARWHHRLLPEADTQLSLDPLDEACGNAIRKAYLSNGNIRRLTAGDLLVFIRTGDGEAHGTSTGVVEATLASSDPNDIVGFVGARTVYTVDEIAQMCAKREVLAVRFRLDRVLAKPWPASTLVSEGVMKTTPQSFAAVHLEGIPWVTTQLGG